MNTLYPFSHVYMHLLSSVCKLNWSLTQACSVGFAEGLYFAHHSGFGLQFVNFDGFHLFLSGSGHHSSE